MQRPISDLGELLRGLRPTLNPGTFAFVSMPPGDDPSPLQPLATFQEAEGLTLILEEHKACEAGLPILFRAAWITLRVHSDLEAIGLTAAVSGALTKAGISCNVVAAAFHDHLFVPVEQAETALAALASLQTLHSD